MAKRLEDLLPRDEVMVELGERVSEVNGKQTTVEKKKRVVMTKQGFDEIEKDNDGHGVTLGRSVKLLGTPVYESVQGTSGPVLAATKFEKLATKKPKAEGATPDESADSDEEKE